jgi:hypothetical protein
MRRYPEEEKNAYLCVGDVQDDADSVVSMKNEHHLLLPAVVGRRFTDRHCLQLHYTAGYTLHCLRH